MLATRNFLQGRLASTNALLAVVCLAQFMIILDVSIVNVALPSIRDGLHFSTTGLQWVVNAYTLTFAGLLMLGGRSADLLGRRRVFLAGTAMFALSSLICALASSRGLLIGARGVQGIAGAITSPATLSIITSTLPEGRERNRGLALWGAMGALGASSGALLGGILTQGFGWQAIFAVNIPLGAIVVALGLLAIPAIAPLEGRSRHFDALGAMLVTAGLITLTFGIVRTDTLGWGSPGVLGPMAAGVALLAAFFYVEARVAQAPLVPLQIFRIRRLRAANLIVVLMYAANFPAWFFITLYLQQVLHYSAIGAGLGFLPMTLSIFAGSTLAPRVVARFGARPVIVTAMTAMAAGMVALSGIAPGQSYVGPVLIGAVLTALGMGFSLVPSTIVAMQGVAGAQSGVASGLLNTSRLMGGALGLAILSTIAAGHTRGEIGAGTAAALTSGFDLAFTVAIGFAVIGALVAAFALRPASEAGAVVDLPEPVEAEGRQAVAA
ncbi:MAG TPA: MFS transporter [Solirubrobacteraceae bacterium]|jgi:EmrB/QacA subfamily drug resistance transporter|nr:MFS transporter [Solirubrobacteraceae bacterium]